MDELTENDIAVLMEALDAYQEKPIGKGFTSMLLGVMLSGGEDKEERRAAAEAELVKAKAETDRIKETVILLKAKLIQARDRIIKQQMMDVMRDPTELGELKDSPK